MTFPGQTKMTNRITITGETASKLKAPLTRLAPPFRPRFLPPSTP